MKKPLFVAAFCFSLILVCGRASADSRPNVLLILADDLGWADLGFQGSTDILSPNLDRMAAQSVRFTDGHVTASVCSPSRAGLMTGRYQQRFGHEANTPPQDKGMDVAQVTMADALKRLGYRTGVVGKWHLGDAEQYYPTKRGFDHFYGLREGSRSYFYNPKKDDKPTSNRRIERNGETVAFDGYLTDVLGDQAISFVDSVQRDPWFLFLSFTAPHGPMHATEADLARFAHIENKKRRTYAAMVWAMDRAIGKVISHLEATGQVDNTIIWFLSDNGGATNNGSINLPLAGHKGIKFEGGIRVPFLMRWTKRFSDGRQFDKLVSSMDIFATSLAAAGGDVGAANLDGVNLLPHLSGNLDHPPHKEMYWHKLWFSAMRDGEWKLIYVQDYGYALYNLANDLVEANNVSDDEPEKLDSMKRRMTQWKSLMEQPRWGEAEQWFRTHSKNHIRIIEGN